MRMKYLIAASVAALAAGTFNASAASRKHQADVQPASVDASQAPALSDVRSFNWSGASVGVELGGNWGSARDTGKFKGFGMRANNSPVSGFIGGVIAGYNFQLDNGIVLGVDTNFDWNTGRGSSNGSYFRPGDGANVAPLGHYYINNLPVDLGDRHGTVANLPVPIDTGGIELPDNGHGTVANLPVPIDTGGIELPDNGNQPNPATGRYHSSTRNEWLGSTRVKVGYALDRWMPYVAVGVAYGRFDNSIVVDGASYSKDRARAGWTAGVGVNYAMTDHIVWSLEYRYTGFGSKDYDVPAISPTAKLTSDYHANDFRVGVAYKF